jgi:long-subunit fatty acid transport protein
VLLGTMLGSARADWRLEAETGALYDSNLSNSDNDSDIRDDWATQTVVRAGNGFQFARNLRLSFGADVRGEAWARYNAFNNVDPGGTLSLRYRFGLGRLAPWVLAEDHLAYSFFNEYQRNGFENIFRVRGGFGFNERLSVEAAYIFDDFAAQKEAFWNLSGHTGSIHITFDATPQLQLSLGYTYRNGEVISYALPPRPDLVFFASERDVVPSFGNPAFTAYRLRGSTHAVAASASYTVSKYISVRVTYEFRDTSHNSLEYMNHLFEAKIGIAY